MSILIKGAKLPKNCWECLDESELGVVITLNGAICPFCVTVITKEMFDAHSGIHPDCPLVEVKTPHGRLIDSDAVEEHVRDMREVNGISRGFEDYALAYGAAQAVIGPEDEDD